MDVLDSLVESGLVKEIGMCNPENYYKCDYCDAGEFDLDEEGEVGYVRIFRRGEKDICGGCLSFLVERAWAGLERLEF
jgi:hypothetical protein